MCAVNVGEGSQSAVGELEGLLYKTSFVASVFGI